MLQVIKKSADKVLIWSDEKISKVAAVTNRQNDRVFSRSSGDLRLIVKSHLRSQKPAYVMVWVAVASDGTKASSRHR